MPTDWPSGVKLVFLGRRDNIKPGRRGQPATNACTSVHQGRRAGGRCNKMEEMGGPGPVKTLCIFAVSEEVDFLVHRVDKESKPQCLQGLEK